MHVTRLVGLGLTLGTVAMAGATDGPGQMRPLSLSDCIQMALAHNLDVQIQRLGPELAGLSLSGAYGAYDPNFTASAVRASSSVPGGVDEQGRLFPSTVNESDRFSAGISGLTPTGFGYQISGDLADNYGQNAFGAFERGQGSVNLRMSQPLLKNFWIDGARLNIRVNKNNLKISELTFEQQVMNTVAAVQQAYYSLIAARETVKVQEKALELAEQLLRENKKRVEVGVLAPLDEKQAESQVAASRADLLGAQSNLRISETRLKNLLTDEFSAWQGVSLEPSERLEAPAQVFHLQDSWSKGLSLRPDLLQARLDLERRNIILRYDKNQLFPQLDLVGSYGLGGAGEEFSGTLAGISRRDSPTYSYGITFSIPLSRRTARTNYRTHKTELERALLQLKKLEQGIMVEVADAIAQAQTSFERVKATEEAMLYAVQAYEAEVKKLENGKSTSFQVLQFQRDVTLRRSQAISALSDYNAALARLALSEGTTLVQNNITVEVK
ncbi:MAG: TolC family protein [Verrucomicrobia bacterium]|nr:TolC family protein [Verrucomicrobiota bacterium]